MNIHWPQTATNQMRPWYKIAYLFPFWCLYKFFIGLASLSVIPFEGVGGAADVWRQSM